MHLLLNGSLFKSIHPSAKEIGFPIENVITSTITKDQIWQKDLFIEVSKRFEDAGFATRAFNNADAFVKALQSLPNGSALPKRISVFGITTLSRAARHILEALSQVC